MVSRVRDYHENPNEAVGVYGIALAAVGRINGRDWHLGD
jgi:hypothetical protein